MLIAVDTYIVARRGGRGDCRGRAVDRVTDDQDAFGRLLQAYLDGDDGLEIVERDDGFVGVAGRASAYFTPERAWSTHERAALAWARGRVLDIGCGAGRHGLALQERGLAIVGIDASPRAIAVYTRRGLREARVLDIARLSRADTAASRCRARRPRRPPRPRPY